MTLQFERVTFLDEAMGDLRRLAERSQMVLVEVFRLLKALDIYNARCINRSDCGSKGGSTYGPWPDLP